MLVYVTLFRNERFMLDEMLKQNASKFAIHLEYENPRSFSFFILCYFIFFPNECPWSMSTKNKVAQNEKWKKQLWVFVCIKYGISLGHFIKHKPLISEECTKSEISWILHI